MARALVVGVIAILLIVLLVLLFPIASMSINSLGPSYFGLVTLDCVAIFLVLAIASQLRVLWGSFVRPARPFGSIVASFATIAGLLFIEAGLAVVFFIVALVSTDCSNGRTYKAGTCDTDTMSAYSIDLLSGLVVVTAMVGVLALARALLLIGLAIDQHPSADSK